MSENEKIKELEAMLVVLLKRITKLEDKGRLCSDDTWLSDLRKEAEKVQLTR